MSKEICKHPFMSMSIMLTGNVSPCCAYSGKLVHINDVDSLDTFFKTNDKLTELRNKELAGEWYLPGCGGCEKNPKSSRKASFNRWADKSFPAIDTVKPVLRHVDISFSNTCNMTCVMCSNSYSSAWADYDDQLSAKNKWPIRSEWSMTISQIDKLVAILDTVQVLEIKGGEPFYDPNFRYLLEQIIEKGFKDLEIVIMTNFVCIDDAYVAILNKLPNLVLNISIDGEGDVFTWVRGYDFNDLESRMLKYLPSLASHNLIINYTSSLYNINNIEKFYKWVGSIVEQTKVDISINFATVVTWPEYLNPLVLTDRTTSLRQIDNIFNDPLGFNKNKKDFQQNLMSLKNHLLRDTVTDPTILEKFDQWNKYLVKMRGGPITSEQ